MTLRGHLKVISRSNMLKRQYARFSLLQMKGGSEARYCIYSISIFDITFHSVTLEGHLEVKLRSNVQKFKVFLWITGEILRLLLPFFKYITLIGSILVVGNYLVNQITFNISPLLLAGGSFLHTSTMQCSWDLPCSIYRVLCMLSCICSVLVHDTPLLLQVVNSKVVPSHH